MIQKVGNYGIFNQVIKKRYFPQTLERKRVVSVPDHNKYFSRISILCLATNSLKQKLCIIEGVENGGRSGLFQSSQP